MRLLIINSVCGIGSTGRICTDLAQKYEKFGYEVKIAYGRTGFVPDIYEKYAVRIGNSFSVKLHMVISRLFDRHGLGSYYSTKKFLKWAESYKPDLLWLHNIHGYYINYELLFKWIKSHPDMEVKWTLHDCWAFTGHCSYFTMARCDKWKTGCKSCPQPNKYPARYCIDNCVKNYNRKKMDFCGINNLTIITPSKWLANLVKVSFLKDYPVEVSYNKVDTDVFKPVNSNFRDKYCIQDKKMVLGVASPWDERKGLEDFIWLANNLDDSFVIVLVGLSNRQLKKLPTNIVGIKRTNSSEELAEIYSSANVFVNPTHEDNYPTTNLEARACGTPVITYRVGGSPESVDPENVVDENDYNALLNRVILLANRSKTINE